MNITVTKKYLIGMAFTCGLLMSAGLASAATVTCNDTPSLTDREFTLTTSPTAATCFDSGNGANDVNGETTGPIQNQDVIFLQGYQVIDKDPDSGDPLNSKGLFTDALDITGAGTSSGTFSFDAPAGFINFIIAFKSGNNLDPVWVAFALLDGITSGSWSINFNSLSHATLYAQVDPNNNIVPLPAALPLLLGALGGLGFLARFRKASKAA